MVRVYVHFRTHGTTMITRACVSRSTKREKRRFFESFVYYILFKNSAGISANACATMCFSKFDQVEKILYIIFYSNDFVVWKTRIVDQRFIFYFIKYNDDNPLVERNWRIVRTYTVYTVYGYNNNNNNK